MKRATTWFSFTRRTISPFATIESHLGRASTFSISSRTRSTGALITVIPRCVYSDVPGTLRREISIPFSSEIVSHGPSVAYLRNSSNLSALVAILSVCLLVVNGKKKKRTQSFQKKHKTEGEKKTAGKSQKEMQKEKKKGACVLTVIGLLPSIWKTPHQSPVTAVDSILSHHWPAHTP